MSEKKLRGIPRRLRAVKKWPERLLSCIPGNVWNANEPYWNWKIPCITALFWGAMPHLLPGERVHKVL